MVLLFRISAVAALAVYTVTPGLSRGVRLAVALQVVLLPPGLRTIGLAIVGDKPLPDAILLDPNIGNLEIKKEPALSRHLQNRGLPRSGSHWT